MAVIQGRHTVDGSELLRDPPPRGGCPTPEALSARLISLLHQSDFYLAATGEGEDSN
jgi:hypothetical protein